MKLFLLCAPKHKKDTERLSEALQESSCAMHLEIPDLLLPVFSELSEFTKVAKRLQKRHSVQISIEGKHILVTGFQEEVLACTEALATFVKQKEAHFEPVHVPIDPLIAKCIESKPVGLHDCMGEMHLNCSVKIDKSSASVSIAPTSKTQPGWHAEGKQNLLSYIDENYSTKRFDIPKPAASEIYQLLYNTEEENALQFKLCNNGSYAFVAGEKTAVQTVQTCINSICSEKQTTEALCLSPRDYDYFTEIVWPQLKSTVTVECNHANRTITISGNIHEVSYVMNSLKGMIQYSVVPVVVDTLLVELFTANGRQDLSTYFQEKCLQVALHSEQSVHSCTLELLCNPKLENDVTDTAHRFTKEMEVSGMKLPKSLMTSPMAQEFAEHCQQLQMQYRVLIKKDQNQIVIGGFKSPVTSVKESLESFMKKKCFIKKSVPIHRGMWRLFNRAMKVQWMGIESQCKENEVDFTLPARDEEKLTIHLKGDKVEVQNICDLIAQLMQSVATSVIPVTRPGLCKYFSEKEKGKMMIGGIENAYNVCIEVVEVGEEMEMDQAATKSVTYGGSKMFSKECVAEVLNMKEICIYTGDITEFQAQVIVNAANEDLKHIGGVAYSILKKGGQVIQHDCDRHVRIHGQVKPGNVWLSKAVGNLPCQALIHAVGPQWQNTASNRQQLQKVGMKCFVEARDYYSIALPAISTGVYNCPMDECANVLISTAITFWRSQPSVNLQEINFVLLKQADASVFIRVLEDQLPPQNIRRRLDDSLHPSSMVSSDDSPFYSTSASHAMPCSVSSGEESYEELEDTEFQSSMSPLNRVLVKQGSILDMEVRLNPVVNST